MAAILAASNPKSPALSGPQILASNSLKNPASSGPNSSLGQPRSSDFEQPPKSRAWSGQQNWASNYPKIMPQASPLIQPPAAQNLASSNHGTLTSSSPQNIASSSPKFCLERPQIWPRAAPGSGLERHQNPASSGPKIWPRAAPKSGLRKPKNAITY